jgi:NADPH:quinone reductase-like Zn-dependent oxidoreductase
MPFHQLEIKELLENPHTPGIDAVGTIISSKTNKFKADDKVIVTSYDLGMNTDGGLEFISIPEIGLLSYPKI